MQHVNKPESSRALICHCPLCITWKRIHKQINLASVVHNGHPLQRAATDLSRILKGRGEGAADPENWYYYFFIQLFPSGDQNWGHFGQKNGSCRSRVRHPDFVGLVKILEGLRMRRNCLSPHNNKFGRGIWEHEDALHSETSVKVQLSDW